MHELKHPEHNCIVTVGDSAVLSFLNLRWGKWDENIQDIGKSLFSSTRLNDDGKEVWVLTHLCSELRVSICSADTKNVP